MFDCPCLWDYGVILYIDYGVILCSQFGDFPLYCPVSFLKTVYSNCTIILQQTDCPHHISVFSSPRYLYVRSPHAGVALTIRHIANGETVLLVAKDIRGHCATVAKWFSERTNRTHPPCSPHVFSFCPLLSCGGERTFSNQALWRECSLELEKTKFSQKLNKNDFPMNWIKYIAENARKTQEIMQINVVLINTDNANAMARAWVLVCWSLTSLCHSNGHIETMPAREINPFTALTRIRPQFLRTQWSTSNHQRVDTTTPQTAEPSGLAARAWGV